MAETAHGCDPHLCLKSSTLLSAGIRQNPTGGQHVSTIFWWCRISKPSAIFQETFIWGFLKLGLPLNLNHSFFYRLFQYKPSMVPPIMETSISSPRSRFFFPQAQVEEALKRADEMIEDYRKERRQARGLVMFGFHTRRCVVILLR